MLSNRFIHLPEQPKYRKKIARFRLFFELQLFFYPAELRTGVTSQLTSGAPARRRGAPVRSVQ